MWENHSPSIGTFSLVLVRTTRIALRGKGGIDLFHGGGRMRVVVGGTRNIIAGQFEPIAVGKGQGMTLGGLLMVLLHFLIVVALKQRLIQTGGHTLDSGRSIVHAVVAQWGGFHIDIFRLLSREKFGQRTHPTETGPAYGLRRRTMVGMMKGRIHLCTSKAGEILRRLLVGRIAIQQVGQGTEINTGQIEASTAALKKVLTGSLSSRLALLLLLDLALERRHFHVQIKELRGNGRTIVGGCRHHGSWRGAHALGFGHPAVSLAALFLLFLASLVSLGNVRAAVSFRHVVPEGLRALLPTQERLGVHPLAALELALDKAAVLADVFDDITDNVGLVRLGLGLLVLFQHGGHERAQPLVAGVEVELFALDGRREEGRVRHTGKESRGQRQKGRSSINKHTFPITTSWSPGTKSAGRAGSMASSEAGLVDLVILMDCLIVWFVF